MEENTAWKTVRSEEVFSSPFVSVFKDQVELPDGSNINDFYTVSTQDASAVVAVTENNEIVLERIYRYACRETVIEIPAGTFEPYEHDGLVVAKRELLEETGFSSEDWQYLGATRECPARLTSRIHLYLAKNCTKVTTQKLDQAENIEVVVVPIADAVDMIMSNEICCNSTVHGIFKAIQLLKL